MAACVVCSIGSWDVCWVERVRDNNIVKHLRAASSWIGRYINVTYYYYYYYYYYYCALSSTPCVPTCTRCMLLYTICVLSSIPHPVLFLTLYSQYTSRALISIFITFTWCIALVFLVLSTSCFLYYYYCSVLSYIVLRLVCTLLIPYFQVMYSSRLVFDIFCTLISCTPLRQYSS